MRRSVMGLLVVGSVLLSACGEKEQRVVAPPRPVAAIGVPEPPPGCMSLPDISASITALFPAGPLADSATARLDSIAVLLGPIVGGPDTAAAQQVALRLVGFTVKAYLAGSLSGGTSDATRDSTAALINGFLCYAGLAADFQPGALTPEGAAQLVPADSSSTVVTGTQAAGMQVDSGSVDRTVLVTIYRLPDSPGPLLTQLDQYPIFYEFHVTPANAVVEPVVVGACQLSSPVPPDPSRLRLAHNVPPFTMGSIEILPLAPTPFLDCSSVSIGARPTGNRLLDLALAGWHRAGRVLASVLAPSRLMAAPYYAAGGVGGTTRNFSPFGAVDTLLLMTPNSATSQTAPAGSAVASPPSVAVRTPQGHGVSGLPVAFAVTQGGGSLTGASATTDATGVATVGSWTLGAMPGSNALAATGTAPHAGSGILGSPLAFTATGLARDTTLAACVPSRGDGEDLRTPFVAAAYPGTTLREVDLFLASNARANRPTPYTFRLTARAGDPRGAILGTSTVTVSLRGTPSENLEVHFPFDDEPAVTGSGPVVFQLEALGGDGRAKLSYAVSDRGDRDRRRGARCPVTVLEGGRWPFRDGAESVGIRIVGAP